ncbi:hypothetical protein [Lachnotalea glycerini]|uniref:Uncharacterized protein n=1 Tax=Lachnotalea glycerini TaxID=1763509 RepID=A0A371JB66_9FIRM|nr:hypothetical protein [Lachnotalea glycerini]RDY30011.1 hypothetical protein CG710_016895 [Lachnotalea glycerini]
MKTMSSRLVSIIFILLGGILIIAGILLPEGTTYTIVAGACLIGWGAMSWILRFLVERSPQAVKIENDERNVQLDGMATTVAYKFAKLTIVLSILYNWFSYKDLQGVIIFVVLYLVSDVIYAIQKRKLDNM